jgi:hypothetical protein
LPVSGLCTRLPDHSACLDHEPLYPPPRPFSCQPLWINEHCKTPNICLLCLRLGLALCPGMSRLYIPNTLTSAFWIYSN